MAKFPTIIVDTATGVHVVKKTPSGYYQCETCHNTFSKEELERTHETA
jgi:hypothetical protein